MSEDQCHLCGTRTSKLPICGQRTFLHCAGCDLIYVPISEHVSPDQQKARYLQHNNSLANTGYVQMLMQPIRVLQRLGTEVHRVLDYGCGHAPVLVELLAKSGYESVGYDPFFFNRADLSRAFDAVVSVETFEHFQDARRELTRITGLIRPGGYLAIATRFHHGPESMQDWWYTRDATHVSFYSHRTLDWMCGEFGMEVLERDSERLALLRRLSKA